MKDFSIISYFSALALTILVLNVALGFAGPPLSDPDEQHSYHRRLGKVELRPEFRLPRTVIPTHYNCELRIVLDDEEAGFEKFTAPGKLDISVEVLEDARPTSITLHSVGIKIEKITVVQDAAEGGAIIAVRNWIEDSEKQFLIINLQNPLLPKGKYTISFSFITPIASGKQQQFGLYYSSYIAEDGTERYMAVTDFESVDARRMVPCFDEPDMKATWSMAVIRKKVGRENYHSLSNMNLVSVVNDSVAGWEKDTYAMLEITPSYLAAISVSDYVSATTPPGLYYRVPVSVWGPPPLMNAPNNGGVYAAETSAKLLNFLETHLKVNYTLPKMDSFAIPEFSAGAMENWGLNNYRIVRLLWIEGSSTIQEKVQLTNTVAHELVHQWFGDLVTMKWWDDLWLNEGFATYFANLAASSSSLANPELPDIHPEYGLNDWVVVDSIQYAMQADVRGTTHPIHYSNLSTPAETRFGFDTISYDKGASLLRMANAFLTEPLLMQGLKTYLDAHKNMNTAQDDLFDKLNATVGVADRLPPTVSVHDILNTWTLQSGFPLIRVARVDTVTPATSTITITQEPFLNDTSNPLGKQRWYVPITIETPTTSYTPGDQVQWLLPTDPNKVLAATINPTEYIILNPQQTSYYRVMYDSNTSNLILSQLETDHEKFDLKTRSALIDDNLNLGFNGYQSIEVGLSFTKYLKNEKTLVPWATFVTNMARPYRLLSRTGAFYYFRKYIRNLMKPTLDLIKMEPQDTDNDDVANTFLLRNRLYEWSCNLGSEECIQNSIDLVESWRGTGDFPDVLTKQPDLRPYVYCTAVSNADAKNKDAVFTFIKEQYVSSPLDTDKISLIKALACSQEPAKLRGVLDLAVGIDNSTVVLAEHRLTALQAVVSNSVGTEIILNHIQDNNLAYEASTISSVVSTLSDYLMTSAERNTVQNFISKNQSKLNSVMASLEASLGKISDNIKWNARIYTPMRNWLSQNYNV